MPWPCTQLKTVSHSSFFYVKTDIKIQNNDSGKCVTFFCNKIQRFNSGDQHLWSSLYMTKLNEIDIFIRIAPPKRFYHICIILQIGHMNIYTFKTIQSNPPLIIIYQIQYFHSCYVNHNGAILIYISDKFFLL